MLLLSNTKNLLSLFNVNKFFRKMLQTEKIYVQTSNKVKFAKLMEVSKVTKRNAALLTLKPFNILTH